ncbi:flagellar motor switch phosphatase FliY [Clostridium gasigenes]|uniref:flagellar motor switch phosphatase FliY n=1 Tax=Clostridium gasigenes TaxID=94869 RepID=UPI001438643B|nr:flagellar motor switch phosphatase FliY [Clostridium gasigenes]NKF06920.1 flagellar motor switch phosphatase FliY [Clostridium gasigenes]QSW19816.1 flagellar motor switch phosphatase FliY [Clostridium gasigenes]
MSNGFLSQEEIDALLNGDIETSKENVDTEILTDIEKDLLGEIGNISMGSASTALYQLVNQQVNITTPVVSVTTLRDIKKEFEYPNIILDVEYTEGIVGRNILIMKVADAGVIANLMMGGDGNVQNTELSEIEISAVQEAMNQMIGSSATSMATMFARIVNISPPNSKIWSEITETISDTLDEDEQIVRVKFNITIGTLVDSEIMQILPIETAKKIVSIMMGEEKIEEPVVEKPVVEINNYKVEEKTISYESQAEVQREPERAPQREVKAVEVHEAKFGQLTPSRIGEPHKNIDLILDVPLNISVVLGRTKKSVKDILNLSTGSLIELDKLAEEPVEILVNGKKIAYGEVVVVDENFGVRITNIVSGADRIKSLK